MGKHAVPRCGGAVMLLFSLAGALAARPASADWLEVLPRCAFGAEAHLSGPTRLLYPRPGLASVATAGEDIVARVRVPTPLTPPPGIQQEAALAGWTAQLHASETFASEGVEHSYRLRVVDVRPDGHSSLVYRATVRVPPWAAPGTYDLSIRAPGSPLAVATASVRVLSSGTSVRVGRIDSLPPREPAALMATMDVDVWLVGAEGAAEAAERAASPSLTTAPFPFVSLQSVFAVRLGDKRLLGKERCNDAHLSFDQALAHRRADRFEPPAAAPNGAYRVDDGPARPLPRGAWVREGTTLRNRSDASMVVAWAFPEGAYGFALQGASQRLGFWPAVPVRPDGQRPAVVGRWRVAPGAVLRATTVSARAPELSLRVLATPTTFEPVPTRVRSSGSVALAWGEGRAAYVPKAGTHTLPIAFHWVDRQELYALAIGPRGSTRRTTLSTLVKTEHTQGCSVAAPKRAQLLWFVLLGWMLRCARRPYRTSSAPLPSRCASE